MYCRGATLLEACLAFSLIMVSVLGCLTALQMAIKVRHAVERKTWALTEMEGLADALRRSRPGDAFISLLNVTKIRLEKKLPGSCLSWTVQSAEQVYHVCFLWTLCNTYRIEFAVMPRDFR